MMKNTILIFLTMFIAGCQVINKNAGEKNVMPTVQIPTLSQPLAISESCLEDGGNALGSVPLTGKLVVYKNKKYGLFNMEQNTFISLPESVNISPDGQKTAQFDEAKNGIVVSDLEGNPLTFFPKDDQWTEANQTLYGNVLDYDPNYVWFDWWDNNYLFIRSLPIGSQLMLNIETSKIQEIEFPYSNEVWSLGGFADIRDYYVGFSPDFDKVVYASTMSHLVLRNNSIYNDGTWRTVTWVGFSSAYDNPSWSPDGSTFAVVMETEQNIQNLFQVYAEFAVGQKQLTDLSKLFNNPYHVWISQMAWSPDGEKIAFVAGVTSKEGDKTLDRLLVLDMASGTLEDYCNPDPDNPYSSSFGFSWSPNGEYIAIDTTIVDLGSRRVYKIPDVYIVNWVGEGKTR